MDMRITSRVFGLDQLIPEKYTDDGPDISPPLAWGTLPAGTKSIALICDDPDASRKTWVHWVIFNLPAEISELDEFVPPVGELENKARQGRNDFGQIGYRGPCPPRGTHRYVFKIYALDQMLDLDPGVTKEQLAKAMEGHILAQGQLVGKYKR